MKIGPLPDACLDAMDPGFHCARTHWIRGFMAFRLARRGDRAEAVFTPSPSAPHRPSSPETKYRLMGEARDS
jgi:hypothetical protein